MGAGKEMTKQGKHIHHERRVQKKDAGGVVYTEQRGLRSLRLETGQQPKPEKPDFFNSENPDEKAKLLNFAANRFLIKAGEKTLKQVIESVEVTKTNNKDAATSAALLNWLATITQKYGAFSPLTVAAQFSFHQWSIIEKLTWYADGAKTDTISDAAFDKTSKEIAELFSVVYAFCDSWHWWRMELHGDHARLIDAHDVATSRQKGSAKNRDKKQQRQDIIAGAFRDYVTAGGSLTILPAEVAAKIKPEAKRLCSAQSLNFISDDQLTRVVRLLMRA